MPRCDVERLLTRGAAGPWETVEHNRWLLPNLSEPRARGAGCADADGRIYVLGGTDGQRPLASVERLDALVLEHAPTPMDVCSWESFPSMPTARRDCTAASALGEGLVYVVGGFANGMACTAVERLRIADGRWDQLVSLPSACAEAAAVASAGAVYVFGGSSGGGHVLGCSQRLDPRLGFWESLLPMPTSRYGCAGVGIGSSCFGKGGLGRAYVLGGFDATGTASGAVEAFDFTKGAWHVLPEMALPRGRLIAAAACETLAPPQAI